jgi:hypothetical protein
VGLVVGKEIRRIVMSDQPVEEWGWAYRVNFVWRRPFRYQLQHVKYIMEERKVELVFEERRRFLSSTFIINLNGTVTDFLLAKSFLNEFILN